MIDATFVDGVAVFLAAVNIIGRCRTGFVVAGNGASTDEGLCWIVAIAKNQPKPDSF